MAAIFDKYHRDGPSVRQFPPADRAWLHELNRPDIDAVVFYLPPDDSVMGWDAPLERRRLDARGIPSLVIRDDVDDPGMPARWHEPLAAFVRRRGRDRVTEKQLACTARAAAFQKTWFADLRRSVFEERRPYAIVQADVPFELFQLHRDPAVSNQWWAALIAAKQMAPAYLDAMEARGYHDGLCRYCSLGLACTLASDRLPGPWGGLPRPALICARLTCDCIQRVFTTWADAFGTEFVPLDNPGATLLPPRWWELSRSRWRELIEPHRLAFAVADFNALIGVLERVSGQRFDLDGPPGADAQGQYAGRDLR